VYPESMEARTRCYCFLFDRLF